MRTQDTERTPAIERFFVLTGGPGSGKTTLLDALATLGIESTTEAGRAIIQDQVATGGSALPWIDPHAFADRMLDFELRSYSRAESADGVVMFDRGLPDIAGYRALCGLPVPDHLERAIHHFRYNRCVFLAPPWPEIFVQDAERKQSPAEAEATFHAVSKAYSAAGYDLVTLPHSTIDARVDFVLAHLRRNGATVTPSRHSSAGAGAPAGAPSGASDGRASRRGPA